MSTMNKVVLSLFKNHNMMMVAADDYVYDDINNNNNKSTPSTPDDLFDVKSEKLDVDKVLGPMKQTLGIKGMETGNLANLRFKYGSPFNRRCCSQKPKIKKLDPNAIAYDPNNKTQSDTFNLIHALNDALHPKTQIDDNTNSSNLIKETDEKPSNTEEKIRTFYNDESVLRLNGFRKIKILEKSLQGHIYLGETILTRNTLRMQQRSRGKKVIIKQTYKCLHCARECIENGHVFIVDEDIEKEAHILQHLTVHNKVPGSSIPKIIEFVESDQSYYIIMRVAGTLTLKEFVDKAHEYIQCNLLSIAHWKKICKYMSWQIVATLHWMHTTMNCAHLDLSLSNVMISNGIFHRDEGSESVTIDRNVSCKIIDFGLSEVFKMRDNDEDGGYFKYDPDNAVLGSFHINNKYQTNVKNHHQCPEIFNEQVYDARNADLWSFGVLLFYMHFGVYPYQKQTNDDMGYCSLQNGKIFNWLQQNNIGHLSNYKLLSLISGCLCIDETQRMKISDVVRHEWYKKYAAQHREKEKKRKRAKVKIGDDIRYYKAQDI